MSPSARQSPGALDEAGYQVEQAANGPVALTLAQAKSHDALILDILLPGMRGDASAASCGWPESALRS